MGDTQYIIALLLCVSYDPLITSRAEMGMHSPAGPIQTSAGKNSSGWTLGAPNNFLKSDAKCIARSVTRKEKDFEKSSVCGYISLNSL